MPIFKRIKLAGSWDSVGRGRLFVAKLSYLIAASLLLNLLSHGRISFLPLFITLVGAGLGPLHLPRMTGAGLQHGVIFLGLVILNLALTPLLMVIWIIAMLSLSQQLSWLTRPLVAVSLIMALLAFNLGINNGYALIDFSLSFVAATTLIYGFLWLWPNNQWWQWRQSLGVVIAALTQPATSDNLSVRLAPALSHAAHLSSWAEASQADLQLHLLEVLGCYGYLLADLALKEQEDDYRWIVADLANLANTVAKGHPLADPIQKRGRLAEHHHYWQQLSTSWNQLCAIN